MPNGSQNPILDVLLGQNLPVDPQVEFLLSRYHQNIGREPVRQYERDFQAFAPFEIMRLLDPSFQARRMQQAGDPRRQQVQQSLGISPEETDSYIRQLLGLELAPAQQAAIQGQLLESQAPLMQAEAARTTAATGQRAQGLKEQEFAAGGTGQEQKADMETRLMSLAMGVDPTTQAEVPQEVMQRAFMVLRGVQSNPGLNTALTEMLQSGDEDSVNTALQLIGLPVEYVAPGWFADGGFKPTQGGAGAGGDAALYDQAMQEYQALIAPLLQGAK